ncbi:MAG: histidine phosphatase family protein [Bacteroidales bacterium]
MKKLILMRHAKSDWKEGVADHDRDLNQRGKRDIPLMTSVLIQKYPRPGIIVCSDAVRTVHTIEGIVKLGYTGSQIVYSPALYLASIEDMQNEIVGVSDEYDTILICAHNPGISDYLNHLCPANEFQHLPVLGIALVVLNNEQWSEIFSAKGRLVRFDYPKKK